MNNTSLECIANTTVNLFNNVTNGTMDSLLAASYDAFTTYYSILDYVYNPVFGLLLCLVIYQSDLRTALLTFLVSLVYNIREKSLLLVFPAMVLCFSIYRKAFGIFEMGKDHMVDGMVALVLSDLPSSEIMEATISFMCLVVKLPYYLYQRYVMRGLATLPPADSESAKAPCPSEAILTSVICNTQDLADNLVKSSKAIMLVLAIFLSSKITGEEDPEKSRRYQYRPPVKGIDYYVPGRALVSGAWVLLEHLKMGIGLKKSLLSTGVFEFGYNMNYLLRSKNVPGEMNNLITGMLLGSYFNGTGLGDMAATAMLAPSSGLVRKIYNSVMATEMKLSARIKLVTSMFPYIFMYAGGVLIGRVSPMAAVSLALALSSYYLFYKSNAKSSGKSTKPGNSQPPKKQGGKLPTQPRPPREPRNNAGSDIGSVDTTVRQRKTKKERPVKAKPLEKDINSITLDDQVEKTGVEQVLGEQVELTTGVEGSQLSTD